MECERKIINHRKDETFLERSYSVKVRVEELERLLGPEDVDVEGARFSKPSAQTT